MARIPTVTLSNFPRVIAYYRADGKAVVRVRGEEIPIPGPGDRSYHTYYVSAEQSAMMRDSGPPIRVSGQWH